MLDNAALRYSLKDSYMEEYGIEEKPSSPSNSNTQRHMTDKRFYRNHKHTKRGEFIRANAAWYPAGSEPATHRAACFINYRDNMFVFDPHLT